MRISPLLAVMLLYGILTGCSDNESPVIVAEKALQGTGERVITFIHFNDLHAHLVPHLDLVPDREKGGSATKITERGGLARTATLVKNIRKDNPHSVLMNIGDTFHGGVEAFYTFGNAIAEPINALGVDVGVPGNWDFTYGPQYTRARYLPEDRKLRLFRNPADGNPGLREKAKQALSEGGDVSKSIAGLIAAGTKKPNFPNLAANVILKRTGEPFLDATLIKNINGVRIGFIGITSDIVPKMHEQLAVGLEFLRGEQAYVALVNQHAKELRQQGVNIVVVMSELGIQKDYHLAQLVDPGVDVFFSAHTHEATFTPLTSSSGALVVEAGNDGYLGRMDITVIDGKVSTREWELIPVTPDIPADADMQAIIDRVRAPFLANEVDMEVINPFVNQVLGMSIDTVVGTTDARLFRHGALQNSFNNTYTDLVRKVTGSQVAITPGFRFSDLIAEKGYELEDKVVTSGDITLEDVYRIFPVAFSMSSSKVTGRNLKVVVETILTEVFSTDVFKQEGGWVNGFSGFDAKIDLSRPDGDRVLELRHSASGKLIGEDEILTVTGCSRPMDKEDTQCSFSGFHDVEHIINPLTGKRWTTIDIYLYALARFSVPDDARKTFTDTSGVALWPEHVFIQPLTGVGKP